MQVGSTLCYIATEGEEVAMQPSQPQNGEEAAGVRAPRITVKAGIRAAELGINLEEVPIVGGRIGVAEVEAYAHTLQQAVSARSDVREPTSVRAVVLGGGRHAACVIDALHSSGYELIGCVDSEKPKGHSVFAGLKVLGPTDLLEQLRQEGIRIAIMGVGGTVDNQPRARLFRKVSEMGFVLPCVIHPEAYVAEGVPIGPGTVVLAKASIGPLCRIGANVLVNQGSIICHHSVVEDHAHIAPGGILAGGCRVGSGSTVGMGATIYVDVTVGAWCLVHNGVSVVADVPDHTTVKSPEHIVSTTSKEGTT